MIFVDLRRRCILYCKKQSHEKRQKQKQEEIPLAFLNYASAKLVLSTPQSGHSKSSGRSSNFVPGAIPYSGAPASCARKGAPKLDLLAINSPVHLC